MSHERAWLLIQQGRWELARDELHRVLGAAADDPAAHSMLAIVHSEMDEPREAIVEAERGVRGAPDAPFAHYTHAYSLAGADRDEDAEAAIGQAMALDPHDPDYKVFAGRMRLRARDWARALALAEEALAVDPEHVGGINLRAYALTKLGRPVEASAAVASALARDPNDARSHANMGWTLLERGEHRRALEHFREALRLRPDDAWAREGIVAALRSRHLVYRLMLRYFLWMSRLSNGAQWGIIIGGYVAFRIVMAVKDENPGLAPYLWPLLGVYLAFVYLTWTADALFDLALRLHPFGRLVLTRDEIRASNVVGSLLLVAAGTGAAFAFTGAEPLLVTAFACATLPIPVSATFGVEGRKRRILGGYTLALAAVAAVTLTFVLQGSARASTSAILYILGFFAFSWVANVVIMRR